MRRLRRPGWAAILLLAACGDPEPVAQGAPTAAAPATPPSAAPPAASAATATPPAADEAPYVRTSLTKCRLLREEPDEAGYSVNACSGVGGYALEVIDSDGRENIVVIAPGGARHSLRLAEMAGNGGFSTVGEVAEWRREPGAERPSALTVRFSVAEDPAATERQTSYLLVAKLGAQPCVTTVIAPVVAQNQRAREAAAEAPGKACFRR